MIRLRSMGILLTAMFTLAVIMVVPARTKAFDPFKATCDVSQSQGGDTSSPCTANVQDPITGAEKEGILVKAVNVVSFITAVAAVIAIIIAGFEYVISTGDSNKIDKAKNALIAAVIGLVIVASAQIIVRFIIGKL